MKIHILKTKDMYEAVCTVIKREDITLMSNFGSTFYSLFDSLQVNCLGCSLFHL